MKRQDVAALCASSWLTSKEEGWLDIPRSPEEHVGWMVSKLSELLKEDREGKPLTQISLDPPDGISALFDALGKPRSVKQMEAASLPVPRGIPIVLADFTLLIAGYVGGTKEVQRFSEHVEMCWSLGTKEEQSCSLFRFVYLQTKQICDCLYIWSGPLEVERLARSFIATYKWCEGRGIDLPQAVKQKEGYNRVRASLLKGDRARRQEGVCELPLKGKRF